MNLARALGIARFEFRYQLFSLQFVGAFLLFFGLGSLGYLYMGAEGAADVFGMGRNVNMNSPYYTAVCMLYIAMLGVFVAPAFVADAGLRDRTSHFDGITFASGVTPYTYLLGRFAGSFAAFMLAYCAAPLGMVASLLWLSDTGMGPVQPLQILVALVVLALPTLFAFSAAIFLIALRSAGMIYCYLFLVAVLLLLMVLMRFVVLFNPLLLTLLEPTGLAMYVGEAAQRWGPDLMNRRALVLDTAGMVILANRAIFVLLGAGILMLSRLALSFRAAAGRARHRKESAVLTHADYQACPLPTVSRDATAGATMRQLWRQIRFEFRTVFFSPAFLILMVLGAGFMLQQLRFAQEISLLLTNVMLRALTGSVMIFLVLVIVIFVPDIFSREKDRGIDQIMDSLPVKSQVFVLSKLLAAVMIVVALLAMGLLIAMWKQWSAGEAPIELALYLQRGLLFPLAPLIALTVWAAFFQVLTGGRFAGMFCMVLYLGLSFVLRLVGVYHPLLLNPLTVDFTTPVPFSDMMPDTYLFQAGWSLRAWWLAQAAVLACLTFMLWGRGSVQTLRGRWRQAQGNLSAPLRVALTLSLLATFGSGGWLFYNMNVLNEWRSPIEVSRPVLHEQRYAQYADLPMPKIAAMDLQVDIYPEERRVALAGTLRLENRTGADIESIHVDIPRTLQGEVLELQGGTQTFHDGEIGYYIFDLAPPMPAGGTRELTYQATMQQRGFRAYNNDLTVLENGTYFETSSILPFIGYSISRNLIDNRVRAENGLAPVQLLDTLEEAAAHGPYRDSIARRDSDHVDFRATVSTAAGQTAVTAGTLQEQWQDNGRSFFRYATEQPVYNVLPFFSAEYDVRREHWRDVDIEIYHHPTHTYTLDTMMEALTDGLEYYSGAYGDYSYPVLRVVEYPAWRGNSRSLPTVIAHSERNGWTERSPRSTYNVMAHELSHHWWGHRLAGAPVEGGGVLAEGLASWSAYKLLEQQYGKFHFLDRPTISPTRYYLRGRLSGDGEVPLARTTTETYLAYYKGEAILTMLSEYLGEEALNSSLQRLIRRQEQSGEYVVITDWLEDLKASLDEPGKTLVRDSFEVITLYDLKMLEASAEELPDGRYRVTLQVEAGKAYADALGRETSADFAMDVEIGLFATSPLRLRIFDPETDELLVTRRPLVTGTNEIELVVDEMPQFAGVDPYNRLIERNGNDNVRVVISKETE